MFKMCVKNEKLKLLMEYISFFCSQTILKDLTGLVNNARTWGRGTFSM